MPNPSRRDMVSRVRSTHRLLSDASINDRTIDALNRDNALVLIHQKTNQRKLWNTDTVFTTIDCLEMKTVFLGECCDFATDREISRSKEKIPQIAEGNFAYLIDGVYDIAISQSIKYTPLKKFINTMKLGLRTKDVYFWIHNDYLYVSSPHVKTVKLVACFVGDVPNSLLYQDCECAGREKEIPCKSPLDDPFKCPGNLLEAVIKMTSQHLLQTYHNIPEDATSNNLDEQAKIIR